MGDGKHTPGPWRANGSYIEGPYMALVVARVDWPNGKPGSAPRNAEEARANASLIAAAPEMLEALTQAAREAEQNDGQIWKDTFLKMRAAIAKAEGRS